MTRKMFLIILAALIVFLLGFGLRSVLDRPAASGTTVGSAADQPERWTCSMHPQIILPSNDQQCPICFMDLIPLQSETQEGLGPDDLALSEQALALADIRTVQVQRGAAASFLRLVGKVQADEARTRTITAQVSGRLDRLFVDTTGQRVSRGQDLALIYSPELYSAQAELKSALGAGADPATLNSVRNRLRLWGLDDQQVSALEAGGEIKQHLVVKAPAGGVVLQRQANPGDYVNTGSVLYTIADLDELWVALDAYEADLALLAVGQQVSFTTRAFPGREFKGQVTFINPVLEPRTRTAEVRLQVPNPDALLKPGMLVTGLVEVMLDAQGQPWNPQDQAATGTGLPLLIPQTAPLLTGDRAVVYVRKQTGDRSVFTGRQVTLGPRAGDQYVVLSGLIEGEEVVSQGAFKVDSALQIQAKSSMMSRDQVDPAFLNALSSFLDRYYLLQTALADDDDGQALRSARSLAEIVPLLEEAANQLDVQGRVYWSVRGPEIAAALATVVGAGDITARRLAFEPLSDHLWELARQFGRGAELAVLRFHCPMAMDGAGAYWLQNHAQVANPYYGASMLRCGTEVEVLR